MPVMCLHSLSPGIEGGGCERGHLICLFCRQLTGEGKRGVPTHMTFVFCTVLFGNVVYVECFGIRAKQISCNR